MLQVFIWIVVQTQERLQGGCSLQHWHGSGDVREKKDCNTLGVDPSKNFHLLSLLHEFHEETGL